MLRLLTLLSALFFASAAAATTLWVDAPRDGYLNLRAGPSQQYHVLDHMPHGSKVKVLKAPGKWLKVRNASGMVGWAHSKFLSAQKVQVRDHGHTSQSGGYAGGQPAGQEYWVYAPGYSGLNLRDGAGTEYPVLITMQQRDKVVELGRRGDWLLIRHDSGAIGWAHGDYLVRQDPGFIPNPQKNHGANRDNHADRDWDHRGANPGGHGANPGGHGANPGGHGANPGGHKRNDQIERLAEAVKICRTRPQHRFERCLLRQLGGLPQMRNW
jgi:uncharacterized protein YraI